MKNIRTNLMTFCVFDGKYFGVSIAAEEDVNSVVETMQMTNIDVAIMAEGNYITKNNIEQLFGSAIIQQNSFITWFILDQREGQTLMDLISGDLTIEDITDNLKGDNDDEE